MARPKTRDEIVQVADRLFYEQGFDSTAFADIAEAVGISRGNFYHHFKTKDDILAAVIALRLARTAAMLDAWEENADAPRERIRQFIEILITNQAKIMQFGCPVGTLCSELAKLDHPFQPQAKAIFDLFRHWLGRQFAAAGCGEGSDRLALHLLMRSQGVASLALAYRDEAFVRREVEAAIDWLDQTLAAAA
jgi:AcrR family transcriptional regulator